MCSVITKSEENRFTILPIWSDENKQTYSGAGTRITVHNMHHTNRSGVKEEDRSPQNGCQQLLVDNKSSPNAAIGIQESSEECEHLVGEKKHEEK